MLPFSSLWPVCFTEFIFQENSYSASPSSMALTFKSTSQTTYVTMFGAANWRMEELFQYLAKASKMVAAPMLLPVFLKELMARN